MTADDLSDAIAKALTDQRRIALSDMTRDVLHQYLFTALSPLLKPSLDALENRRLRAALTAIAEHDAGPMHDAGDVYEEFDDCRNIAKRALRGEKS